MKNILTFIGTLGLVLSILPVAQAEVLSTEVERISLREFNISAIGTLAGKRVTCSAAELKTAINNLISFGESDNSRRKLKPTLRPLDNEAAWKIDNEKCKGLAPYLNGIGFEAYNQVTGEATIYLAGFNPVPVDERAWARNEGDGLARMRMMFRPDFTVVNMLRFPATCEVRYSGMLGRFGYGPKEFVCALNDSKGLVIFDIHDRD